MSRHTPERTQERRELGGYDQVFQVRKRDLDEQLHWLWEYEHLPDRIDQRSGDDALEAKVTAPTLFLREDGIRLELQLPSGFLAAGRERITIDRWTVAFVVRTLNEPIDHSQIRAHQKLPDDVKQRLLAHPEDRFRIMHLYVSLREGAVRDHVDRSRSRLPALSPTADAALLKLLEQHLREHVGKQHGLHLGFTPVLLSGESRFAPTLVDHSISEARDPADSSLNYLMMTGGRPRPTGPGAGRVPPIQGHSEFRLSHRRFVDELVLEFVNARIPDTALAPSGPTSWESRRTTRVPAYNRDGHEIVWPGHATRRSDRFLSIMTIEHREYGHCARIGLRCNSIRDFVSERPRENTTVGASLSTGLFSHIAVVDGHLRVFNEPGQAVYLHSGTEEWLRGRGYVDLYEQCVARPHEDELATAMTAITELAAVWDGLSAHVLPAAQTFTYKHAGATPRDGFINLTAVVSYKAVDSSKRKAS